MKKTLTLLALLSITSLTGCASNATLDTSGTGNRAFDEAAATASAKNTTAMKAGYAWTSTAIKNKYGSDKTEDGKAFKASGKKLSLVDVALYEGEQALKKGDEATAMKKAKLATELADAQLAQQEISSKFQIVWK
jgi:hypothetical protein